MIVDNLGDYSFAYYLIGIGIAISGFILTTILIFDKCEDKKKKSKEENLHILYFIHYNGIWFLIMIKIERNQLKSNLSPTLSLFNIIEEVFSTFHETTENLLSKPWR